MSYLAKLQALDSGKAPTSRTAKTAKRVYGSEKHELPKLPKDLLAVKTAARVGTFGKSIFCTGTPCEHFEEVAGNPGCLLPDGETWRPLRMMQQCPRKGGAKKEVKTWLRAEGNHSQAMGAPATKRPRPRQAIHPAAVAWLKAHRDELRQSGWTAPELWRRNRSIGIAWVGLWERPGLAVSLEAGGVIAVFFESSGRTIRQTARPMKPL